MLSESSDQSNHPPLKASPFNRIGWSVQTICYIICYRVELPLPSLLSVSKVSKVLKILYIAWKCDHILEYYPYGVCWLSWLETRTTCCSVELLGSDDAGVVVHCTN